MFFYFIQNFTRMFAILFIFISLWSISPQKQNCINIRNHDSQVQLFDPNENVTLNRFPRGSRVRTRIEKPVDCAKLHTTEDTPFIAIILNRASGRLLCMGSIIDERNILTADRCVRHTDHRTLKVLLGYFKAWWGRHSYVFYVEKVVKHESELVLLRLKRNIIFSRTIRPIKLLREEDGKPTMLLRSGNGTKDNETEKIDAFGSNSTDKKSFIEGSDKKNESSIKEKGEDQDKPKLTKGSHDDHTRGQTNVHKEKYSKNRKEKEEKKHEKKEEEEEEEEEEPKGVEIAKNNTKISSSRKKFKTLKRATENDAKIFLKKVKPLTDFKTQHPDIKEILLVGFPLTSYDVIGDPIPQSLVYIMKQEDVLPAKDCLDLYHPLTDAKDKNKDKRIFCSPGTSKFCWGCLGGPTIYKRDQEYLQAGVVGGADCDKDEGNTPAKYLHIRVDVHMNWIMANSLIPQKL